MKTFSQWLLEERKLPTPINTYKDKQGVLRWKSNHHKVKKQHIPVKHRTKKIKERDVDTFVNKLFDGAYTKIISEITKKPFKTTEELIDWFRSTKDWIGTSGQGLMEMFVEHNRRMYEMSEILKKHNIDEEDYIETINQKLKEYCREEDTELTSRVTSESMLLLLNDKRFKTQYEVKSSSGHYFPSARSNVELIGQGIPYDYKLEFRPIYGSLKHKDNNGNIILTDNDKHYGNCVVVLNSDLRNRTTITFGDSYDNSLTSSDINTPDISSINFIKYKVDGYKDFTNDDIEDMFIKNGRYGYPEIQIHEGVSVNDISYVIIDNRFNDDETNEVIQKLKEQNIKVYIKKD